MVKKATKPLHLQKQKPQRNISSPSSSFGPRKLSSNAWCSTSSDVATGEICGQSLPSWDSIKQQLIEFHDTAKVISLKSLLRVWNCGGSATALPFEYAERLYGMAKIAIELGDYHGAKVMILAAGLLHQDTVMDIADIIHFVEENDCNDESYEDNLAESLPFCYDSHMASASPDAMGTYLSSLDLERLKTKIASCEPLIALVFNDGTIERKVPGVNSLITLNTALSRYGEINSKISSVRVKHNGTRVFLSRSGKKSLSDLGIVNNDVVEIENIAASPPGDCIDVANSNANHCSQNSTTVAGKQTKKKRKKKAKGKK
mmetsp:Transcript_32434/g.68024  ORF Transcript_32434/g.68024 Transcript_32434/m.68024 type:complete len:316 (-) Transcript_32434:114-1061(-)